MLLVIFLRGEDYSSLVFIVLQIPRLVKGGRTCREEQVEARSVPKPTADICHLASYPQVGVF